MTNSIIGWHGHGFNVGNDLVDLQSCLLGLTPELQLLVPVQAMPGQAQPPGKAQPPAENVTGETIVSAPYVDSEFHKFFLGNFYRCCTAQLVWYAARRLSWYTMHMPFSSRAIWYAFNFIVSIELHTFLSLA